MTWPDGYEYDLDGPADAVQGPADGATLGKSVLRVSGGLLANR